jgi:5'-deoxynucleotidase YfbR-like HD superfamily hydrolase
MSSGTSTDAGWIVTHSGRKVYPLAPEPGMFDLNDIAHALSNTCRFTGHCKTFYSVAQHSVLVSKLVRHRTGSDSLAMQGLLHDATEAYLCDVARPVKHADGFAFYREAEQRLWESVAQGFGLPAKLAAEVKDVDNRLVCNEALTLLTAIPDGWFQMRPFTEHEMWLATDSNFIVPVGPDQAYRDFIKQFYKLQEQD